MKKLFLLISLCVLPVTAIKPQDQLKPCNPCERAQYYKLRAEKATTQEQFDEMWAKSLPYQSECEERTEHVEARLVKAVEGAKIGVYLLSGLIVVKIIQELKK